MEGEVGRGVVDFDGCLGERVGGGFLGGGFDVGGVDAARGAVGEEGGEDVEPVDGEIIEDDVADGGEVGLVGAVVGAVERGVGGGEFADVVFGNCLGGVGEMGGPAAVF